MKQRDPIELDERRCFTGAQKARMFERAKGRCELCGTKIRGAWIAGHIIPWALGGRTEIDNGRVECMECAKGTHAEDTSTAAKAERMAGRKGQYARRKRRGPKLKGQKLGEKYARLKAWKERKEKADDR